MPQRRGGGAARHWGDPAALERQAFLEALAAADDEMLRGEMPLSPGSVLGLARRVPGWLQRLKRTLTPQTGASTAPTGNVLQKTVLSDKPAQMSRRGFLLDPVQMLADTPQALKELGHPPSGRAVDIILGHPSPRNPTVLAEIVDDGMNRYEAEEAHFDAIGHEVLRPEDRDALNKLWDDTKDEVLRGLGVGEKLAAARSDRPGILGDIETVGRNWGQQSIKEIAEATGKSVEEVLDELRRWEEEPGPVAQAAESVRRRFGRGVPAGRKR
jgi:hypothetical protein